MHFDGKNQAESEFENSNFGGKGCSRIIWEDIRESRIFSILQYTYQQDIGHNRPIEVHCNFSQENEYKTPIEIGVAQEQGGT